MKRKAEEWREGEKALLKITCFALSIAESLHRVTHTYMTLKNWNQEKLWKIHPDVLQGFLFLLELLSFLLSKWFL